MNPEIRPTILSSRVSALLQCSQLPTSDLLAGVDVLLFSAGSEHQLQGVVGLQVLGPDGLLRSLAVSESDRGKGVGQALVRYVEQYAASLQ